MATHNEPMTLVTAHMFAAAGRRSELVSVLAKAEETATRQDGCLGYTVAASIVDANHYIVVEEWRDHAALEAHYASESFARFQYELHGLLAHSSEATIRSVVDTHRPLAPAVMDPRDAD
jgi:quinol monooxygenase YgiN